MPSSTPRPLFTLAASLLCAALCALSAGCFDDSGSGSNAQNAPSGLHLALLDAQSNKSRRIPPDPPLALHAEYTLTLLNPGEDVELVSVRMSSPEIVEILSDDLRTIKIRAASRGSADLTLTYRTRGADGQWERGTWQESLTVLEVASARYERGQPGLFDEPDMEYALLHAQKVEDIGLYLEDEQGTPLLASGEMPLAFRDEEGAPLAFEFDALDDTLSLQAPRASLVKVTYNGGTLEESLELFSPSDMNALECMRDVEEWGVTDCEALDIFGDEPMVSIRARVEGGVVANLSEDHYTLTNLTPEICKATPAPQEELDRFLIRTGVFLEEIAEGRCQVEVSVAGEHGASLLIGHSVMPQ